MDPESTTGVRFGIDLGGTKIELIALDRGGRELLRRRTATPRNDYPATVEAIARLLEGAERELGASGSVGIGTPGAVSRLTGRMKNCNSVWLNGMPLLEDLQCRLERPVRISNDANCFALSEATDGVAAGAEVVFGVIIGTGCGAGIVVRGEVLPQRIAGEWGHNPGPGRDDRRPARTAPAARPAV
jgi:predicted NBD/HSP70 family sugar kinase